MSPANGGYTRLEFSIPARGLIGYRGEFMTDTKGNGIMNTIFDGYAPYKGDLSYRKTGSLIAYESGESITYGLFSAQERGTLFIGPGVKVYSGMVVGQNPKAEDIEINVCKTKKLTNTRSSSADEALKLTPPKIMSLEQALDFIDTDELLELTPESLENPGSDLKKESFFQKINVRKINNRESMENGAQMDYTWYPVYDRIVSRIDELLAKEKNRQVTVAIDGMCGSGKITLGRAQKDH